MSKGETREEEGGWRKSGPVSKDEMYKPKEMKEARGLQGTERQVSEPEMGKEAR